MKANPLASLIKEENKPLIYENVNKDLVNKVITAEIPISIYNPKLIADKQSIGGFPRLINTNLGYFLLGTFLFSATPISPGEVLFRMPYTPLNGSQLLSGILFTTPFTPPLFDLLVINNGDVLHIDPYPTATTNDFLRLGCRYFPEAVSPGYLISN
jgi:hypothetical protein